MRITLLICCFISWSYCYSGLNLIPIQKSIGLEYHIKAADSLYKIKNYKASLKSYNSALAIALDNENSKKIAFIYKKLGIIYYRVKDYPKSQNAYWASITKDSISENTADVHYNLFLLKRKLNEQDSIIYHLEKSLNLYESNPLGKSAYNTFLTAGIIYKNKQEYENSINYLIKAYDGFEKLNNIKKLTNVSTVIGNVHYRLKNYNQALEYHQKAFLLHKSLKNKRGIARGYMNIGNVYDGLKKLDSAINNYKNALDYLDTKSNLYAKTASNLGQAYKDNNQLILAEKSILKAVESNELQKDTTSLLYNYNGLTSVYLALNDNQKTKLYIDKTEVILKATSDQLVLMNYYENKSNYLKKIKDYKLAVGYQQKYNELYKNVYDIEKTEIVQNIQSKFEKEKKENIILKLTLENQKNELQLAENDKEIIYRNFILILLLFVIVLISIVLYIKSQKQKVREQQIKIAKLEAISEGQESIKKRIARDLHDIIATSFLGLRFKVLAIKNSKEPEQLINETANDINEINNQIRTVSHRLSPLEMQINNQPFTKIIKARLSEFQLYSKIFVELENQLPSFLDELDISKQTNLYGILLEILNNVKKHSHATRLTIKNKIMDDIFYIIFQDNGIGIQKNKSESIGILNIKQRAEILGGSYKINSSSSGTVLTISFPVKNS